MSENIKLVGVDGVATDGISLAEALSLADEHGLDLVQVGGTDDIAVCKLMDYGKMLYEQKRQAKLNAKNRVKQDTKEIRLSDAIAEHDMKVKAKAADRILSDKDKVKVVIQYRGRLVSRISYGKELMNRFEQLISVGHMVDAEPKIDGNRVYMVISPKKG